VVAVAEEYQRAFNERDFDAWVQVLDPEIEIEIDTLTLRGIDAALAYARQIDQTFPGMRSETVRTLVDSGDTVVLETRPINPHADSGDQNAWHLDGLTCMIFAFRDGRVTRLRHYYAASPNDHTGRASVPSRVEAAQIADEQAALRRVATLVARGVPHTELFAAVAREVGEVLGVDATHLGRFDADGTVVSVGQWGAHADVAIGARFSLEGDSVSAQVFRTDRPARIDGYEDAAGTIAATVRGIGIRFSIGAPISVDGRTWGVMIATTRRDEPFPPQTESRLERFTELLATAISNASAHDRLSELATRQAALRRVATLVARETPQSELFAAIAEEIGELLRVDSVEMIRYEDERFAAAAAAWGRVARAVDGSRVRLGGRNVTTLIFQTRRPARLDDYTDPSGAIAAGPAAGGVRSAAGAPIFVEGRLWGAMIAATTGPPLPPHTESRIAQFTELMATAIANADARAEVTRLAAEQSALRRVATLVAQGATAQAVFNAVTAEVRDLVGAEAVVLARYDGDELIVLANRSSRTQLEVGQRVAMDPANLTAVVRQTGRIARRDDAPQGDNAISGILQRAGVQSRVVAPVVVEGRTWGVLAATWTKSSPPEETERRMASFARLLDTAIGNADSRDQLLASRARVLAAGDDARRRVVRDLHDGAQQRLVHAIVTLKLARQAARAQRPDAETLVDDGLRYAEGAIEDLRELSHGILPLGLMRGGLGAAVDALVSRLELPVDVDVTTGRLPRDIEASAYFILAEALTNIVKHAAATHAAITAAVDEHGLHLEVRDDGVGRADPEGFGLLGIADRVDALGGQFDVQSGDRSGTVVTVRLPPSTQDSSSGS
jgi:signal transduction histidine kinase